MKKIFIISTIVLITILAIVFGFFFLSNERELPNSENFVKAGRPFIVEQIENGSVSKNYEDFFSSSYTEKDFKFNFSDFLEIKIYQQQAKYADLEKVELFACGKKITSEYARYADTKESLAEEIKEDDLNMAVIGQRQVEILWNAKGCKEGVVTIKANAHNETLPFRYPRDGFAKYSPKQEKTISIDGILDEVKTDEADFYEYWKPTTGHPYGYVYIYVNNDEKNLYFSIDATMDNTNEPEYDWAEIEINNKKFRIDDGSSQWGKSGFGISEKVSYKHQFYEFSIPKSELNLQDAEDIYFAFRYYGTAGGCSAMMWGSGTSADPCQVEDWNDLNNIRGDDDAFYILMADLSSSSPGYSGVGDNWEPIGSSLAGGEFEGYFWGNGHSISDLIVPFPTPFGSDVAGLFGYTAVGDITDLSLTNANITGTDNVGGLVGYHESGNISGCSVSGTVTGTGDNVGSLVGHFIAGSISDSYATANVTSTAGGRVGGLVGYFIEGSVTDSYATGNVSATGGIGAVGGLIGYVVDGVTITRGHATGAVSGAGYGTGGLLGYVVDGDVYDSYTTGNVNSTGRDVGGLIGGMYDTVDHIISGSYATGTVTASSYDVGGLVGILNTGSITDCYATGQVTGLWGVGGLVGYQVEDTTEITNSYATGNVIGTSVSDGGFGGLVGYKVDGTITKSYATGDVSGYDWVGGLAGNQELGLITDSYATGDVAGAGDSVGGLVGLFDGDVTNSFSIGSVSGVTNIGGLLGLNYGSGTVTNSFWDTQTSGQASSAGGTGTTTSAMKLLTTFGAWDIGTTTSDFNTGYPFLSWQGGVSSFDWLIKEEISNIIPNVPVLVSPADASTVDDSTPTLSANYHDSDVGDVGVTNYRIATSSSNCLTDLTVATGTSAVTSDEDENTSWTPDSAITDGTYYWCTQNNDGTASSAWTAMGSFIIDTVVSGGGGGSRVIIEPIDSCDPHGDINKDRKINLTDFSILMYFWGQTKPSNPCADINQDGVVNLKDFSAMLYWWTG